MTFDEVPPPGRGRAGAILALVLCLATVGLGLIEMSRADECGCEEPTPAVAVGDAGVWATTADGVGRFDAATGDPTGDLVPIRTPRRVAAGFGAVWVSAPAGLWRIEPGRTSTRLARLRGGYRAVAAGAGAVWAAGSLEPVLVRIDPDTRREVARIRLPRPGREVAGGASGVWISFGGPPDEGPGTVARLDPVTERLGPEIELPGWASGIAVDDDGAWVAVWDRAVVVRVPADGGAAEPPINVRRHPVGIALIGGAVLVASDAGVVTRIDPVTGRIEGLPTIVGGRPYAVAAGDAGLWVSSQEGRTLRRVPVG